MSKWNHSVCDQCFEKRQPGREPVRVVSICCDCGVQHRSGIYVRGDPKQSKCQGSGPSHDDSVADDK